MYIVLAVGDLIAVDNDGIAVGINEKYAVSQKLHEPYLAI